MSASSVGQILRLLALAACLGWLASGERAVAELSAVDASFELEQIEATLAAHPDDPDLLWAHALALSRAGATDRAAAQMAAFEARWPDLRSDAVVELARLYDEAGQYERALEAAGRAIAAMPDSGPAHFYLGLALRGVGRQDAARAELEIASVLAPSLAPETLLVRALDMLDQGNDDEARSLLNDALDLNPVDETARRIRLLLVDFPVPARGRRLTVEAAVGFAWDSNVTLDSGSELIATSDDQQDWRFEGGLLVVGRPIETERWGLAVGYFFSGRKQFDNEAYDVATNALFASPWVDLGRARLSLRGALADTVRDGGEYLRLATLSPAIAYDFGRSGATSLSTELSYRDYRNESAIEPLKRGGLHVGVTVEHFVELWPDAIGRLAGLWWRTDTDASAVPAFGQNFDGDYDHDGWGVASRLTTPLAWGVELEVLGSLTGAHYANDNFIAALATGDLSRKRRDLIVNAGVSFTRPIHRHVELELAYGFTDRDSNVPDFDYDRQIFRLGLRATFD